MKSKKKKILIFVDWFTPGYKAGGPIRSVSNLIDHLADEIDFYIVTSDRDLGDQNPYENIHFDKWINKPYYNVIYLSRGNMNSAFYQDIYAKILPDFVYLNSLFSYLFSILPLKSLSSFNPNIYLSPRGMLGDNSLQIKPIKKKVFLLLARAINFYKNICWIASNDIEKQQIVSKFGKNINLIVAPNLPIKQVDFHWDGGLKKEGELSLLYICRISPIKNIDFLIGLLNSINGKVKLAIVGPVEDHAYWGKCLKHIKLLNENVFVEYLGEKSPSDIQFLFNNYHCFISSSFNENYGHSIVEALSFGCPVIVSEQTPWRELESYFAGFSLELNPELFTEKIQFFLDMNNSSFLKYKQGALNYFKMKIDLDIFKDNYRKIFS